MVGVACFVFSGPLFVAKLTTFPAYGTSGKIDFLFCPPSWFWGTRFSPTGGEYLKAYGVHVEATTFKAFFANPQV